jgi:hypothetical protein
MTKKDFALIVAEVSRGTTGAQGGLEICVTCNAGHDPRTGRSLLSSILADKLSKSEISALVDKLFPSKDTARNGYSQDEASAIVAQRTSEEDHGLRFLCAGCYTICDFVEALSEVITVEG